MRAARRSGTATSCRARPLSSSVALARGPYQWTELPHEGTGKPWNQATSRCYKVTPIRGSRSLLARCYDGIVATVEEPTQVIGLTERAAVKIRELQADEPEGDASV